MEVPAQNKPPTNARPCPRGGGASSSAPPKVYRVEPREFRDLVQRLTGAPPTALRRQNNQQHHQHHHRVVGVAAPVVQPQPVRAAGTGEQQAYGAPAPWFSFPMAGGVEAAAQPQHGAFL
jgi:hypothetical protein